jgi:hypothetical protein
MAATMQPTRDDDATAPGTAPLHEQPEPDDIPDVETPPALVEAILAPQPDAPDPAPPPTLEHQEHEALLVGFCQHLSRRLEQNVLEHHKSVMATMDAVCDVVRKWAESTLQGNEHAAYQLSNSLETLGDRGLVVVQNPYQATIQVRSPQGYLVTVHLAKREANELLDALGVLLPWLQAQHYTADVTASV